MPRKQTRKRFPSDDWAHRKAKGTTGKPKPPTSPTVPAAPVPRGKHHPRRKAAATAAPPLLRSVADEDFRAFTTPRGAPKSTARAVPTLESLAAEEAPQLAGIVGGTCAGCGRAYSDDDRHCVHCGTGLRHACPKCDRPLRGAESFCRECGTAAPSRKPAASLDAPPPPQQLAAWEADDCFMVSAAVNWALVAMDGDLLPEEKSDRINARAAAVVNKRFRVGSRWKEEIELGFAIAGALFPVAYIHFVVGPDERRQEERARKRREAIAADAAAAGGVH